MQIERNGWLEGLQRDRNRPLRVFALPYAGGSSYIFRTWRAALPAEVQLCPVQLPGRGTRLREPLYKRMDDLIHDLGEALVPYCDQPFAFLGHSMGGLISYELARYLNRTHRLEAQLLVLSGCTAAHLRTCTRALYKLADEELIEELRTYGGSPSEVLGNSELMAHMLPILRADIELIQTYIHRPDSPLRCRIHAFAGSEDCGDSVVNVAQWSVLTEGPFDLSVLAGGHFFIHTAWHEFLRLVNRTLTECVRNTWAI